MTFKKSGFYLSFFIIMLGGSFYFQNGGFSLIKLDDGVVGEYSQFGVSSETPLVLYTLPTCEACISLKEYLAKRGLQYVEYDISTDKEALERYRKHKIGKVPAVFYYNKLYLGFNRNNMDSVLR